MWKTFSAEADITIEIESAQIDFSCMSDITTAEIYRIMSDPVAYREFVRRTYMEFVRKNWKKTNNRWKLYRHEGCRYRKPVRPEFLAHI